MEGRDPVSELEEYLVKNGSTTVYEIKASGEKGVLMCLVRVKGIRVTCYGNTIRIAKQPADAALLKVIKNANGVKEEVTINDEHRRDPVLELEEYLVKNRSTTVYEIKASEEKGVLMCLVRVKGIRGSITILSHKVESKKQLKEIRFLKGCMNDKEV